MLADRDALDRDLRAPIADHGAAMDPPCNVALRHDGNTSVDTRPPADRRKGGANFAFADGHLKYMKADDAWSKDDTMWDLK
jgi:prepilin-type processing-associated H-X9-DG protein